jgi:hypothetical protein
MLKCIHAISHTPPTSANGTDSKTPEIQVEQDEDDHERDRHHDRELRLRPLEILELPAPFETVAGRDADLLRQCALRVGDVAADVAVVHVD